MSDDLKDAIADGYAEINEIAEANQDRFAARVVELINNPAKRNKKIWDIALKKMEQQTADLTRLLWESIEYGRTQQAAEFQAFIELGLRDIVAASHKAQQIKAPIVKKLTRNELDKTAKEGVSYERFIAAKDKRKGNQSA